MKTIELAFCDAGGGHRAAATALCDVAQLEKRPWTLRMTNLMQLFAEFDLLKRITGVSA
jgi:1,2-diacylglycerol 3-beta-galactosyltransferase